jgi:hypothetical protein
MVFVDGILQREGSGNNYVSSGSTITFTSAPDSSAEIDVYTLVKEKVSIDTVADGSITVTKLAAGHPTWNGAGETVIATASTGNSLRITNTGSGNSLLVEDSASTDSSPFVITAAGDVGVGTSSPSEKLEVYGTTPIFQINDRGLYQAQFGLIGNDLEIRGSSGVMEFYTGAADGAASTLRATLDSVGNLGLGVVPSANQYGKNLQINQTILNDDNIDSNHLAKNAYYNSGWKYYSTGYASKYTQSLSIHSWSIAASGTVNNAISFTQAMTLDASGNLGVGTTSPDTRLDVTRSGNGQIAVLQTSANRGFSFDSSSDTALQIASIQGSTNMDLWANTLSFSAGATERMRITSAGNVGIGTTSPLAMLNLVSTTNTAIVRLDRYNDTISAGDSYGQLQWASWDDNFGGGVSSVRASIDVIGDGAGTIGETSMLFRTAGTGGSQTERMRINHLGYVGIGTSPDAQLHVAGQIRSSGTTAQAIYVYGAPATAPYITINQYGVRSWDIGAGTYSSGTFSIQSGGVNGVYISGTGTAWASASDERIKDIIEPISNALTKVNNLRSVIGKYKTDEEGVRRSFLIAQDIQTQFPEALESSDPDKLGVQYTDVIPLLVASIKELKAIVDAQAVEIAALKAK